MESIPCIDCICLPICKVRYTSYVENSDKLLSKTILNLMSLLNLEMNCSIIKEYTETGNEKINVQRLQATHDYFNK